MELEVGGGFYTLAAGVPLENAKDKLGILYLTELEDAAGRPGKVCSWLKQIACVQVTCESKSDWDAFKAIAAKVSELSRIHLPAPVRDVVMTPLAHDTPAEMAQRVVVMYAGRKVEEASVEELFAQPQHPYTAVLIGSIPSMLAICTGVTCSTNSWKRCLPGAPRSGQRQLVQRRLGQQHLQLQHQRHPDVGPDRRLLVASMLVTHG